MCKVWKNRYLYAQIEALIPPREHTPRLLCLICTVSETSQSEWNWFLYYDRENNLHNNAGRSFRHQVCLLFNIPAWSGLESSMTSAWSFCWFWRISPGLSPNRLECWAGTRAGMSGAGSHWTVRVIWDWWQAQRHSGRWPHQLSLPSLWDIALTSAASVPRLPWHLLCGIQKAN